VEWLIQSILSESAVYSVNFERVAKADPKGGGAFSWNKKEQN
jgi:hypothetical protein